MTEISSKDLVNHIELIKVMMNQNGFTFKADEESWARLIASCRAQRSSMKLSLATSSVLMKVDTKDYLGFALNNAINKIIIDRINKGLKNEFTSNNSSWNFK